MRVFLPFVFLSICLGLPAPYRAAAGQWMVDWRHDSADRPNPAVVQAEIFKLADLRLSRYEKVQSVPVTVSFKDDQAPAKLGPGEFETFHVFIFFSTAEYERQQYATVSTVICTPKKGFQPRNWEPRGFTKAPLKTGAAPEQDPRRALFQARIDGKPALPPLPGIGSDGDKPWADYDFWYYKDYDKAYPLADLERVFSAAGDGAHLFNVVMEATEGRDEHYVYPSTIVADSLRLVSVDGQGNTVVRFRDIATGPGEESDDIRGRSTRRYSPGTVTYHYRVDRKALGGLIWRNVTSGSQRGVTGSDEQEITIPGLPLDKKCRVTIYARWDSYDDRFDSAGVTLEFATVPGHRDGDDDEPPIHDFDLPYTGN